MSYVLCSNALYASILLYSVPGSCAPCSNILCYSAPCSTVLLL